MRNKFYARAWSILRPLVMFFLPVELRGTENLGDEAAILCANHSSAWDPILLVLAMPQNFNVRIMAKKQLFSIPVVGWFLRNIGVFPVDRGNSDINAVKTAITSLRDGWNLLIFPEGTRVKQPGQVTPKSGAGMMAIRSGVKMVPVFIGTKNGCSARRSSPSANPSSRSTPGARARRRSIRPTPTRSCVVPTRWVV